MNTNVDKFKSITNEMVEIYERKNSDYGNSIHDTYVKYGPAAYLVRMEDKINRVRSLTSDKEQKIEDEKVRDTLIDLANYAILMLMEIESEKESITALCFKQDTNGIAIANNNSNISETGMLFNNFLERVNELSETNRI